jgi:alkylation response protein AidB-like acyl-CoA dehydrogenase
LSIVVHFGSEQQRKRFLPDGYTGKARWCLGVTEPEGGVGIIPNKERSNSIFAYYAAGSDVAAIRTTATLSSDGKYYTVSPTVIVSYFHCAYYSIYRFQVQRSGLQVASGPIS